MESIPIIPGGIPSCKFDVKVSFKYFQGFPFRFWIGGGILYSPPFGGELRGRGSRSDRKGIKSKKKWI